MASPQRENGYTGIANEILENLSTISLNGTQFRIIMVIFRYTYGFQRKGHELSESFISEATGINKQQIKRELKGLIGRNIILILRESTYLEPRTIAFNKNYEEWGRELISALVAKKLPGSGLVPTTGSGLDTTPNIEDDHINSLNPSDTKHIGGVVAKKLPGSGLDTQERKDICKESIYIVFQHWNSKKIITHKSLTEKIGGHINARFEEGYTVKEIIEAIDNYEIILRDNAKYFWSYKWGLSDFLVRGLDKFKTESDPFSNYANKGKPPPKGPGTSNQSRKPKSNKYDGCYT